jgi:CRISPR-associated exonuclease Cas4
MNPFVLVTIALAVIGLLVFLLATRVRAKWGLASGETEAIDNVTLTSARHGLVGRPDRVVRRGNTFIPEEWKSARRVSRGHELQLGAYFILVEERYGTRPPHGWVVLGDGSRAKVVNTDALRTEVLSIAVMIRDRRRQLSIPIPVRQPPNKCRSCGQRANCQQASG